MVTASGGARLETVAAAFAGELDDFERAAEAAAGLALGSRAELLAAGRALEVVAASDQRLGEQLAALAGALNDARVRRSQNADAVARRVDELRQRTAAWEGLSERYRELAEAAAGALGALFPTAGGEGEQGHGGEPGAGPGRSGLLELAGKAGELADVARVQGFSDVEEQASALAGQLTRTHTKLIALG